jgi:hypothetical protein
MGWGMFRDAKQLASEAIKSRLGGRENSELSPELIDQILETAWAHQSDPEPRKRVREILKDEISRAAILGSRREFPDEN